MEGGGESTEDPASASRITGSKRKSNTEDLMERAIREELRQSYLRIDEIEREAKVRIAEERELTGRKISEIISRFCSDASSASAQRSLKLKFREKISQPVTTGEEIKGEGDVPIEVALVDRLTGNIVDIGPEAYANVEVVLLKGDFAASEGSGWTSETFNENIVREVEGKTPFLVGNVNLELQRGVAVLREVKLKHDTIKIKPPEFRLGARVIDATTANGDRVIKEATTESFNLVYYHKKYVEKYSTPLLSDYVYRLVNIAKNGTTAKSLEDVKILTVEDFLIQLLIDPEKLEKIFKLGKSKWDATVNNARACRNAEDRIYCYINPEQTIGCVFNVFGQVSGLYLEKQLITANMLSQVQKVHAEKLLSHAFKNWESTVSDFNDKISLEQHLRTRVRAFSTSLDQAMSETPGTTVGRSSSTIRNINAAVEAFFSTTHELSNPGSAFSCDENSLQRYDTPLGQTPCPTPCTTTPYNEPTLDSEVWIQTLGMSPGPHAMVEWTSEMDSSYYQ